MADVQIFTSVQKGKQQLPANGQVSVETNRRLEKVAEKSSNVLLRISSVFPFDFFPDELTVDQTKVSVVKRDFFETERVYSIALSEVADITMETAPFFATLKIQDRKTNEPIVLRFLKKNEATRARRIIQGLLVTKSENVSLGTVDEGKAVRYLEEVGTAHRNGQIQSSVKPSFA